MHCVMRLAPLGFLVAITACAKSTAPSPTPDAATASARSVNTAQAAAPRASSARSKPPKPRAAPASKVVAWDAPIAWKSWDEGLAQAKAESKPILVFVYADW